MTSVDTALFCIGLFFVIAYLSVLALMVAMS